MDKLPLLDLDFRTTYVEGNVLYTPSKGSLVSKAIMGTGVVGNINAPTITKIGASFDGTDYVGTGATNLFDNGLPRTLICRIRPLSIGGTQMVCSTYAVTNPHMYAYLSATAFVFVMSTAGGNISITSNPITFRLPTTITVTYDGTVTPTSLTIFQNGIESVASRSGTSISGSLVGTAMRIGDHPIGGTPLTAGTTVRRVQIYPFCMTTAQVRAIHERFEREGDS